MAFLLYHLSNPAPLDWYKHYVFLAQAFLQGRVDLRGFPEFYQDLIRIGGKVFIPFPPMPAVLLLPSVLVSGTAASEVLISKVVGAVNVGLMWLVLGKLKTSKGLNWLLTIFFGFGTVHWYAAQMGTTWFYAHIVGVMFILLALVLFLNKRAAVLVGMSVGAAALSREPMIGAGVFFGLMWLKNREWKKIGWFAGGVGIMLCLLMTYNWWRFGNILDEGFGVVAEQYRNGGYPYTIFLKYFPSSPRFGQFDGRNIPLHVYTMVLMPPIVKLKPLLVQPSPYGMSLILTSPLLLLLLGKPRRRKGVFRAALIAAGVISIPIVLHFTQGWLQFGYRFALDFMPFLIIMLALRLDKITKPAVVLTAISVAVNAWGIWWAQRLGW